MMNKLMCLFLSLAMLFVLAIPALAQETGEEEEPLSAEETASEEVPAPELTFLDISTREEFLQFAENCRLDSYSVGLVVTLKRNIDLMDTDFACIPTFSGVFMGEGKTIYVDLTAEGSSQGLFRYLTTSAVVRDLTVKGNVMPGGSAVAVGAVAGENNGTIQNCTVSAEVSGSSYTGGIAGINGISGLIENCKVSGQVDGLHFVGGIAGENKGVIRGCENNASVNNISQQNTVELSDITLEIVTDSESSASATDIGGIAGLSTGVIRDCRNLAEVGYPRMGFNVGGIAGTQSGHIADCLNNGSVQGRKEVGGIAGQMEPVSYVEFSADTLQILKDQLGTISGLVNKATINASGSAGAVSGQLGVLQDQANTAWEAVETLLDTSLMDIDKILAAQNTLTTTLSQLPGTIDRISGAAQSMVGGISRDFKLISEHIGLMSETLNDATQDLGGSIQDISDLDTDELLAGKILNCINRGSVLGDLNVGGIAGAIGFENDMDILEDLEFTGEESLNFDGKIRAVILRCDNYGVITGSKQNVGGIVGWQSLGLVRHSLNTGKVDGTGAEQVGGVSGFSIGIIRNSGAKGEILGDTCVGGIAGSGTVVTDCLSAVRILDVSEKKGAVLGARLETEIQQEEGAVSGNYYLPVDGDVGAVDGISYDTQAQPLDLEAFLALEHLPAAFRMVTIRFEYADSSYSSLTLAPGEALPAYRIPAVPEKDGMSGEWENLSKTNLDEILYDMTFAVRYEHHAISISSAAVQEDRPLLLAEGLFGLDARLDVTESDHIPQLAGGELVLGCWEPVLSGRAQADSLRFLIPAVDDPENLLVYIMDDSNTWRLVQGTVNGSYLVFPWQEQDFCFAIVQAERVYTWWYLAGGGVAVLAAVVTVAVIVKRKKKNTPPEQPKERDAENGI